MELRLKFFKFPDFERTGPCDIKKLLQNYNLYIWNFVLKSTLLRRKFGVLSKDFAAKSPKIIDNVISSSSPSVIYDYISKQSSSVCDS